MSFLKNIGSILSLPTAPSQIASNLIFGQNTGNSSGSSYTIGSSLNSGLLQILSNIILAIVGIVLISASLRKNVINVATDIPGAGISTVKKVYKEKKRIEAAKQKENKRIKKE